MWRSGSGSGVRVESDGTNVGDTGIAEGERGGEVGSDMSTVGRVGSVEGNPEAQQAQQLGFLFPCVPWAAAHAESCTAAVFPNPNNNRTIDENFCEETKCNRMMEVKMSRKGWGKAFLKKRLLNGMFG